MLKSLKNVNLDLINEEEDNTDLKGEIACAGGACELPFWIIHYFKRIITRNLTIWRNFLKAGENTQQHYQNLALADLSLASLALAQLALAKLALANLAVRTLSLAKLALVILALAKRTLAN